MEGRTSIYMRQVLSEPLTRSVTGAVILPPPLKKLALKLYLSTKEREAYPPSGLQSYLPTPRLI